MLSSWWLPFLVLLSSQTNNIHAKVECETTSICEKKLRRGSKCVDGFCTNPFVSGCLYNQFNNEAEKSKRIANNFTFLQEKSERENRSFKKRVCNSYDGYFGSASSLVMPPTDVCIEPLFEEYTEIRILSQNWESAMFSAWVMQIVLSEIMGVPASIESSGPGKNLNFYDPDNSFDYGAKSYDFDALKEANKSENSDCRHTIMKNNKYAKDSAADGEVPYTSCAHVLAETWNGQYDQVRNHEKEGVIEPTEGSLTTVKLGWFVPKFTAMKDLSLLSYYGLQGEQNREKVARTFKRPTSWEDYCRIISDTNCTIADEYAERAPNNDERSMYFKAEAFTGYFRATEKNDCSKNPNCTGHITDLPCDWSTFATAQAYHLNIPVESNGPLTPNGGYSYTSLQEIWEAANMTKSPVLFYWWFPDPMYQRFIDTDSEFTLISLPPPKQKCVEKRVTLSQRCSDDFNDRIGPSLGSCDTEFHTVQKLVTKNLYSDIKSGEESKQSPAYEVIKGLGLTELQLGQIFDYWEQRNHADHWNYDPRDAVCQWVVENLESLELLHPRSYPRVIEEKKSYDTVFFILTLYLSVFVTCTNLIISFLVFWFRRTPVMQFSQPDFLYMLLIGLLMVSIGSIMLATKPTNGSCIAQVWLVTLGYTLELAPLIVKIGAINKLMRAASKMKRIKIEHKQLYSTVIGVVACIIAFLVVWTILDPPRRSDLLLLTDQKSESNESIIVNITYCLCERRAWNYASYLWLCALLFCTTCLAYQTRNVRSDFNESQTLAFMVYSHFVSLGAQVVIVYLGNRNGNNGNLFEVDTLKALSSIFHSIDVLVALQVYFVPKFFKIHEQMHPDNYSVDRSHFSCDMQNSQQSRFVQNSQQSSVVQNTQQRLNEF